MPSKPSQKTYSFKEQTKMLMKKVYKMYEGAYKRMRFENAHADRDYRGDKYTSGGKRWRYDIVKVENGYQISKEIRSIATPY